MAKKKYSLDLNGASSGEGSLGTASFAWDTDATGLQGAMNSALVGGFAGWILSGTGPFEIDQPEACGNFILTVSQGTLDTTPALTETQQWTPTVTLSRTPSVISEPSDTGYFIASIAATHSAAIVVGMSLSGTATVDVDYTASSTSMEIQANESSSSVSIQVLEDVIVESDETVIGLITSAAGGEIGSSSSSSITIVSVGGGGGGSAVNFLTLGVG